MKKLRSTTTTLTTILAFITLAAPLSALASTQVIMGGKVGLTAGVTQSISGHLGLSTSDNSGLSDSAFPVSGTLSQLTFYADEVPGGVTTRTGTLKIKGVTTLLACTIASTSNSCTDTHTVTVAAGDTATFVLTNSGTPAGADGSWSFVFTPTVGNNTVFLSTSNNNGSSALDFFGLSSNLGSLQTTDASAAQVMPEAGVLDQLQATSSSITSGSYGIFIFQNGATTSPAITCTIGTPNFRHCADTSNSVSVATGDTFSIKQQPASPGTSLKPEFGTRFVPTTAGNFDFLASTGIFSDTAGAIRYLPLSTGSVSSLPSVEASSTMAISAATTFTSMTLLRSAAPGNSKNATYTLRVNNADSSLTCTLTGTGTGGDKTTKTCTGSVSVNAGDLLDWSDTLSPGGTAGTMRIGLVGHATVNTTPARHMRLFEGFRIKLLEGGRFKVLQQ